MIDSTVQSISDPLVVYWESFVGFLPQLVGALVVLIVGLIVASIVGAVFRKLLELAEGNAQVQNFLQRWDIRLRLSKFVGKFVWWVIFLVFLSAAVQILQVAALTDTINALVAYLPALFAASVVAVVTFVGARVVRGLVVAALDGVNFSQTRFIGTALYTVLVVFGLTLAAAQLGLDTTLVTANITVIIAGVALAFALAFGLGGREAANKIVNNLYENNKEKPRKATKRK